MEWKDVFEAVMLICFGASWPFQILKTVRVKNPTGKSFLFETLVIIGYVAGSCSRLISGEIGFVLLLYFLDLGMVLTDLSLSIRYTVKLRCPAHAGEGACHASIH